MKYLIIGDGIAGATAAKRIRDESEDADVKIFTDESEPLYNRIMLKSYMKGDLPAKKFTRVHDRNWYDKRDIDLYLETQIEDVDVEEKSVVTEGGDTHDYDKLLVATGGSPRKLPQDENFENLHYMWTMEKAEKIKNSAEEADKAVVVGGGLLGIDLAMAYAENDAETYYLIKDECWWKRGIDTEGAGIIHRKLKERGVNVMTETEAKDFEAESGEVTSVELNSDEILDCDSVAVAIGQEPNSDPVEVEKNDYSMIKTDKRLRTSAKDVFAAGNMVEYYSPVFERRTVNGSWDHSEEMGKTAALNMTGRGEDFDYVNTYGVGHFDVQFLSIGDWKGDPIERRYNEDEYRRLFFDGKRLVGAVMIGYTKGQEKIKELIREKEEFEDNEKLLEKEFWQ